MMTPYDLAKMVHRELSPLAPRLSASLNRALLDIGEGSVLVGLGPGTHQNDDVTFQEMERINIRGDDPANVLFKISAVISKLEEHSSWRVIVDQKPGADRDTIELLYTFFREKPRI
jgi:hypothetical protein